MEKSYKFAVSKLVEMCEKKSKEFKAKKNELSIDLSEKEYKRILIDLKEIKEEYEELYMAANTLNELEGEI